MKQRLIVKIFRRALFSLAMLAILAGLIVVEENWRGKQAWKQCKSDLEAQGEHLDLAWFIPPPVPDDRNFAMTPLLKPLLDYTLDPLTWKANFKEPNPPVKKISVYMDDAYAGRPSRSTSWQTGDYRDLGIWQNYYRSTLPDMAHHDLPAEDVLAALGRFDPMLANLREAAKNRPLCRFPVKYEDGYFAASTHCDVVLQIARVLALRAVAELNLNRPDDAFLDIQFGFRLVDSIRDEPGLVSGVVRISMVSLLMQPVWEGIASHRWNDNQLDGLGIWFRRMDFLSVFVRTVRFERAETIRLLTQLSEHRDSMRRFLLAEHLGDHPFMSASFAPGWFYQNMALESRFFQEMISATDLKNRFVDVRRLDRNVEDVNRLEKSPCNLFARFALPDFSKTAQQFLEAQIYVDEAATACAIEQYRLVHYALPVTLNDLHIAAVPHDVVNGKPLHYRVTDAGHYVLYSVGWNGIDDGGKASKEKNGTVDFTQGDIVWSPGPL